MAWLAVTFTPTTPAMAEGPGPGARLGRHLVESPQLLDDPGGGRSRLEQLGVDLQLYFNTTLGAKLRGGVDPNDDVVKNSGSYDLLALVDFEELMNLPGLGMLVHVKGGYNRNINPDVGAIADPIDDSDFDAGIYVAQLYLSQSLWEGRVSLRLGYLDQQTMIDRNAYANSEDIQFLNTALDNNLLVPLKIGFGAMLLLHPFDWLSVTMGGNDADNNPRHPGLGTAFDEIEGWMAYLQMGAHVNISGPRGALPGSYRVGMFYDATERIHIDSRPPEIVTSRGHFGGYLSFDQLLYREGPDDLQGLGVFARWGIADDEVNTIRNFWSLGFQYLGLIPGRNRDALGFGVYQGIGSARFQDEVDPDFDGETGLELYYRWQALPWLALTPDFQYIINPGGRTSAHDAAVLALRGRISF